MPTVDTCPERSEHTEHVSLATRASLLGRLKNLEDEASWDEFFNRYWRLIYGVARKAGLTEVEAQEVVQETVISAARHLPGFQYDPKVCAFKTWLLRLTRWRIIDVIRKRLPASARLEIALEDDASAVAMLDRLPNGAPPDLEKVWRDEWEHFALTAALERVKQQVRPEQFQVFDLLVTKGMPVAEVADLLGFSTARVYLTKHRVGKVLKKELLRLDQELA